mmetsp:Transcript_26467/g.50739  ORF Transcript_26467/g.50739 Transcript_26467/m.50739 type:complete len:493 (-) Transcript_26467:174-1652(-)
MALLRCEDSQTSQSAARSPSLTEMIAQLQASIDEQVTYRESLNSKLEGVLEDVKRATNNVAKKYECVNNAKLQVEAMKKDLQEEQSNLECARAKVGAAFKTRAPRLNFDSDQANGCGNGQAASAAIVSTLRGAPTPVLNTFISYHLSLGFDRLYLYFDDPHDVGIAVAASWAGGERVEVIPADKSLRQEWETCTMWQELSKTVSVNNMSRQQLNCELAARRALHHGIAWLVHIDIDELFHLPGAFEAAGEIYDVETCSPVARHFGAVPASVPYLAYLNHEAVPEKLGEFENYFEEVTLFRRNPHDISGAFSFTGELDVVGINNASTATHPQLASLKYWTGQTKAWLDEPCFFHAYCNGKSAARVTPGLCPRGVHRWDKQPGNCQYVTSDAAHILHFSNCGEASFIKKHQWLQDCTSAYVSEMPFYRKVVGALRAGDEDGAQRMYRNLVALLDPKQVEQQLIAGVCLRVAPMRMLDVDQLRRGAATRFLSSLD